MPADPFATMKMVRVNARAIDPAIDIETTTSYGLMLYRQNRQLEHLAFEEGKSPDLFLVQKLPRKFVRGPIANLEGRLSQQRELAFSVAVHRVECANGDILVPDEKWFEEGVFGTRIASDKWMELISKRFHEDTIDEFGLAALDFAKLAEGAKGPFSLRHT